MAKKRARQEDIKTLSVNSEDLLNRIRELECSVRLMCNHKRVKLDTEYVGCGHRQVNGKCEVCNKMFVGYNKADIAQQISDDTGNECELVVEAIKTQEYLVLKKKK